MTYVNIEWNYNEVQSIISALDRASTSLKKVPTPSTTNTGSTHHATLMKHLTALDAVADVMREIQRYNDAYTHRYPVRPPIGHTQADTSATPPR